MTLILQRFTTDYLETEDRIRLAGDGGDGAPLVIWLTQRMLKRLLPPLLRWLEAGGAAAHAGALQAFAQQAARAEQQPQPRVLAAEDSRSWVAQAADVTTTPTALALALRGGPGDSAMLHMDAKLLRQWLGILYEADRKAEWGLAWPAWLRDGAAPPDAGTMLH